MNLIRNLASLAITLLLVPCGWTQDLSGRWLDSNGALIDIAQNGKRFSATPVSEGLKRWWTAGEAQVTGTKISILYMRGAAMVDRDTGTVTSASRLDWANGSNWQKQVAAKPVPQAVSETPVALFPETYTVPPTYEPKYVPGEVTFFNEAGYVARFNLSYFAGGQRHSFDTGSLAFKARQQHVAIPAGSTNIHARGEYWSFGWHTLFDEALDLQIEPGKAAELKKFGFKSYGTVFDPAWNSDVEPWVPIFEGEVNVTNASGAKIYVGYCTDLTWSIANGAAGIMMALADNLRTSNPNAVRLFAIALTVGINPGADVLDLFRDISVPLVSGESKMVVSTSIVDSVQAFFDVFSSTMETLGLNLKSNIEQDGAFQSTNIQMNPIIAGAGILGARTLNLVIFNEDLSRYWIVPTTQDESWIIERDSVHLAKHGTLRQQDPNGRSYPSVSTGYKIPPAKPKGAAPAGSKFAAPAWWCKNLGADQGWSMSEHERLLADVDGDGRQDLVGFGGAGVYVALSSGTSFADPTLASKEFGAAQGWPSTSTRSAGDVNGDGRDDLIVIRPDGPRVALSNGKGFEASTTWRLVSDAGKDGWATSPELVRVAPRRARDGHDCLWYFTSRGPAVWEPDAADRVFRLGSYRGSGVFGSASNAAWGSGMKNRYLADINGDGLEDIVGIQGPVVMTARSITYNPITPTVRDMRPWSPDFDEAVADVDGDGRDDLVYFGQKSVSVRLSQLGPVDVNAATAAMTGYGSPVEGIFNFGSDQGWSKAKHLRLMGDVDGDQKADIVAFTGGGVLVSLSRW